MASSAATHRLVRRPTDCIAFDCIPLRMPALLPRRSAIEHADFACSASLTLIERAEQTRPPVAGTIEQLNVLRSAVQRSIVGQEDVIEALLWALLSSGHALLEGLPGLGKTRAVKSVAAALGTELHRLQFTPDLLPSDVTGSVVYHSEAGEGRFRFEPGPIFGSVVLVDEINRGAGQGAVGTARSDGGTPGDHRRRDPSPT